MIFSFIYRNSCCLSIIVAIIGEYADEMYGRILRKFLPSMEIPAI